MNALGTYDPAVVEDGLSYLDYADGQRLLGDGPRVSAAGELHWVWWEDQLGGFQSHTV